MIEAIVWGAGVGILAVFLAGLRRLPWRHSGLVGLGYCVVFTTLRLSAMDVDSGLLVLLGAVGGGLAALGHERGERERARRSASILAGRPSSLG